MSVVIPTFNRADLLLTRALPSVLSQPYPELEVLVVDDASTDDTAARLEALGDPRVRLIRQPGNGGVARARNRGMNAARGAFVAFLDSDDEWLPDSLPPRVETLRAAPPRTALLHGGVETFAADGRRRVSRAEASGRLFETLLARNVVPAMFSSNGLMRREVIDAIGGFDPSLPAIEDWEYAIRAARFFDVAAIPEPLSRYYDDAEADAAGPRRSRRVAANLVARRMLHRRYALDMRAAGVEAAFLKDSARRHFGAGALGRVGAVEALLRALKRAPARGDLYLWLASSALPGGWGRALRRRFPRDVPGLAPAPAGDLSAGTTP